MLVTMRVGCLLKLYIPAHSSKFQVAKNYFTVEWIEEKLWVYTIDAA